MTLGFTIWRRAAGLILLVYLATNAGRANARPIEFSEPTDSNERAPVNSLSPKPSEMPIEERIFKPYKYKSPRDNSFTIKRAPMSFQSRPATGLFGKQDDWMQMAPDRALMKALEKDTLKSPADPLSRLSDSTTWDPFNIAARRNEAAKADSRSNLFDFNRLNAGNNPFDVNETVSRFTERSTIPAGLPTAQEMLEQKQQADRLEEFKKSFTPPTPMVGPVANTMQRSQTPVLGTAYLSDPGNLQRLPNGMPKPAFEIPKAPQVPTAPVAPGQSSLTPSTYTQPKPKPVVVTAPRRNY